MKRLVALVLVAVLFVGIMSGAWLQQCYSTLPTREPSNGKIEELYKTINAKSFEIAALTENNIMLREAHYKLRRQHQDELFNLKNRVEDLQDNLDNAKRDREQLIRSHLKVIENMNTLHEETLTGLSGENEVLQGQVKGLQDRLAEQVLSNYGDASDFTSFTELQHFVANDLTDKINYTPEDWDCEDYVFALINNALAEGKRLYPVLVVIYQQPQYIVGLHMMAMALIPEITPSGEDVKRMVVIEAITDEMYWFGILDKPETWRTKFIPFLK